MAAGLINKKYPTPFMRSGFVPFWWSPLRRGAGLFALDGQETVARVLVDAKTVWQVSSLWALILAEVVDSLLFAAA